MNLNVFRTLSAVEFAQFGQPILNKIFIIGDASKLPFHPSITSRKIIFHYPWCLDSPLLEAIMVVGEYMGDTGFLVSMVVDPLLDEDHDYRWYIPFSEKWRYPDIIWGALSNFIFSPTGKWGILLDYEIGMIGGTPEFMNALEKAYPEIDNELVNFLLFWEDYKKKGFDTSDIVEVLKHVYGDEEGERILSGYDL